MINEQTLLSAARGSVVAPAGCGKTELIARAVKVADDGGILVLTHTHAGVKAIKDRLSRRGIDRRRARVETIAGWCLRYASAYPSTAQLSTTEPIGKEWNAVYEGALRLLDTRAIQAVVRASYRRVFVDEYQDCTSQQHLVVDALGRHLPTCVLGDPLQGIFSFAGATLSWRNEVERAFPPLGSLAEPWRWRGRNEELGRWLLALRDWLSDGTEIDLSSGPITWHESTLANQQKAAYSLAKKSGPVIAIRKWARDAHAFARNLGGILPSMEEMDCNDLLSFASDMDKMAGTARAARLLHFAGECFTEVKSALEAPLAHLERGTIPDSARYRKVGAIVTSLADVARTTGTTEIVLAMKKIESLEGAKMFRRELWREAVRTFTEHGRGTIGSIRQTAWALRNRHRYTGRAVDDRSVSRTLLIKGLEFDHAVVLDADEFEDARNPGDGARNFYVAATRAAESLVVLSRAERIRFSKSPL